MTLPLCSPAMAELVFLAVELETGVTKNEIQGPGKWASVWLARKLAALTMRDVLGGSYPEIGRMIQKDHASANHAVKCGRREVEQNEHARALYERIAERVKRGIGSP